MRSARRHDSRHYDLDSSDECLGDEFTHAMNQLLSVTPAVSRTSSPPTHRAEFNSPLHSPKRRSGGVLEFLQATSSGVHTAVAGKLRPPFLAVPFTSRSPLSSASTSPTTTTTTPPSPTWSSCSCSSADLLSLSEEREGRERNHHYYHDDDLITAYPTPTPSITADNNWRRRQKLCLKRGDCTAARHRRRRDNHRRDIHSKSAAQKQQQDTRRSQEPRPSFSTAPAAEESPEWLAEQERRHFLEMAANEKWRANHDVDSEKWIPSHGGGGGSSSLRSDRNVGANSSDSVYEESDDNNVHPVYRQSGYGSAFKRVVSSSSPCHQSTNDDYERPPDIAQLHNDAHQAVSTLFALIESEAQGEMRQRQEELGYAISQWNRADEDFHRISADHTSIASNIKTAQCTLDKARNLATVQLVEHVLPIKRHMTRTKHRVVSIVQDFARIITESIDLV